jgi:hypothetical protein
MHVRAAMVMHLLGTERTARDQPVERRPRDPAAVRALLRDRRDDGGGPALAEENREFV